MSWEPRYTVDLDASLALVARKLRAGDDLGAAVLAERVARDAPDGLRALLLDLGARIAPGPKARHDRDPVEG